MNLTIERAISNFGAAAKAKLANPAANGQPEDQIRAPFEQLLTDVATLSGFPAGSVVAVGESSVSHLKTRPDYAVTVQKALVGFIELKAPGKGSDPRKFRDPHDKGQWERLHSLPNLLYTDGNGFSLWQDGKLVGPCFIWMAISNRLEPNSLRRPVCKRSLKTFCAGNRFRPAVRGTGAYYGRAFAGCCAMK